MNTYGYLYQETFDPIDPQDNCIDDDDGRCGDGQFSLESFLEVNKTYILVVTTSYPGATGTFSITSKSHANVSFTLLGEYDDFSMFLRRSST
jgi:hypothetical protein